MKKHSNLFLLFFITIFYSCNDSSTEQLDPVDEFAATKETFGDQIDFDNPYNYASQTIPSYIDKDNTTNNPITDDCATLGRVLFYDKNLSIDNSVSCASCHIQELGFGDDQKVSDGVNGAVTGRHSMRLVNARFSDVASFFWDKRASTLEEQTTQPIQSHEEMGYSGQGNNPDLDDLIIKLGEIDYYKELFTHVYGDDEVTEIRIQKALAQFVRSIQSFDSKYDEGRAMVNNNGQDFPNFTEQENLGKELFMNPPMEGGAGCIGCHRAPEFDIDPNSLNNGVITTAYDPNVIDLASTKSPTLRDLFDANGNLNGPMMHDGSFDNIIDVIEHYNNVPVNNLNTSIDPRLFPRGMGQRLFLDQDEKEALAVFLKTLSGKNVYTDQKWSDPFQ